MPRVPRGAGGLPGHVRVRRGEPLKPIVETLPNGHCWWRIAERAWSDPLDPDYAQMRGGRWNPPGSYPTLYLSEDRITARLNLRRFIADWPYEPEDLRADNGPLLIGATLPRDQNVADAHSPRGVAALNLPATYPLDARGKLVPHALCQPIGQHVRHAGLRGVRARSAQSLDGAGRELAWFPATAHGRARRVETLSFDRWFRDRT